MNSPDNELSKPQTLRTNLQKHPYVRKVHDFALASVSEIRRTSFVMIASRPASAWICRKRGSDCALRLCEFPTTKTLTRAQSGSSLRFPYKSTTKPISFAYVRSLGHITNASESMTMPARFHAFANSIAPCRLPALTSPAGMEPALLMKRMGNVCCLQVSRIGRFSSNNYKKYLKLKSILQPYH